MKRLASCLLILALLSACESRTQYGECVGIADDKDPGLRYKVSVRNAIWSIVFFETIFAPVIWLANEVECPVGKKT